MRRALRGRGEHPHRRDAPIRITACSASSAYSTTPCPSTAATRPLSHWPSTRTGDRHVVVVRPVERRADRVEHRVAVHVAAPRAAGAPPSVPDLAGGTPTARPGTIIAGPVTAARIGLGPPRPGRTADEWSVRTSPVCARRGYRDCRGCQAPAKTSTCTWSRCSSTARPPASGRVVVAPAVARTGAAVQIRLSKMTCSMLEPVGVGDQVLRDRPARAPVVGGHRPHEDVHGPPVVVRGALHVARRDPAGGVPAERQVAERARRSAADRRRPAASGRRPGPLGGQVRGRVHDAAERGPAVAGQRRRQRAGVRAWSS